jgi:hypothetical protein
MSGCACLLVCLRRFFLFNGRFKFKTEQQSKCKTEQNGQSEQHFLKKLTAASVSNGKCWQSIIKLESMRKGLFRIFNFAPKQASEARSRLREKKHFNLLRSGKKCAECILLATHRHNIVAHTKKKVSQQLSDWTEKHTHTHTTEISQHRLMGVRERE